MDAEMSHPEFARIIQSFEQVAQDALGAAADAHRVAAEAASKRAQMREDLNAAQRELAQVRETLKAAGHVIAEKITSAAEHVHDAEMPRKRALLDAARIARSVHL